MLLVELEGLTEEVDEVAQEVKASLWDTGARGVQEAEEAADRERLWSGRKSAFGAFGNITPNLYLADGVVPRTRLTEVLGRVGQIGEQYGIIIANVFHAGDGNLHPCMLFDERQPGEMDRVLEASGEVLKVCVEAGGTLTGEHGVGLEKKEYMPLVYSQADLEAMLQVRQAFAPANRLNPGEDLPRRSAPSPRCPAPRPHDVGLMPVLGSRRMRHPSFTNIAHRGASAYAPENTLAAFGQGSGPGRGTCGV